MSKKYRPGTITVVQTGWRDTAFICRKCTRKLGGGFGPDGKHSLRSTLRDALRQSGQRGRLGLIEIACLGLCPKRAITMGLASNPGALLVVARSTPPNLILARMMSRN